MPILPISRPTDTEKSLPVQIRVRDLPAAAFGGGDGIAVQKLVLLILASHADADGTNCYPSKELLARECCVSVRTIHRALKSLEARGLLRIAPYASPRHTHAYTITLPNPDTSVTVSPVSLCQPCHSYPDTSVTPTRTRVSNNLPMTLPRPTTCRAKKPRDGAQTKTEATKTRHAQFKAAIASYWTSKNPGSEMPWGPQEGKALGIWLGACPKTTLDQFKGYLRNRFRSEINHAERPSLWISKITSFAGGPLDRYGQPKNSTAAIDPMDRMTFVNAGGAK